MNELLAEKLKIDEEIALYKPPIPRCDEQFNFLLEERARIRREIFEFDKCGNGCECC